MSIQDILRGSAHALTIFKPEAIAKLEAEIYLKRGKPYLEVLRDRERAPRQSPKKSCGNCTSRCSWPSTDIRRAYRH